MSPLGYVLVALIITALMGFAAYVGGMARLRIAVIPAMLAVVVLAASPWVPLTSQKSGPPQSLLDAADRAEAAQGH